MQGTTRGKPPQPGNPHGLTRDQHVLPRASIARFAGPDGFVECCCLPNGDTVRRHPKHHMFCADRVWNQHAESGGTTTHVETAFKFLVDRIESGQLTQLDPEDHIAVTKFFGLVIAREQLRDERPDDLVTPDSTSQCLTDDEKEILEKKGYFFVQEGGVMESRMAAGMRIFAQIPWVVRNWGHWKWGIIRSQGPQFVVSDTIQPFRYVPVGPTTLLAANNLNLEIDAAQVQAFNRRARQTSKRYYFAQDLSKT